ncbi:MAG: PA2779 family protein [Hahellaceae bacterium]|jgi:hypothetical protein|nr:PA2779 family protein [Hahellaceae bacterium]
MSSLREFCFKRFISKVLIFSLLGITLQIPLTRAAMLPTLAQTITEHPAGPIETRLAGEDAQTWMRAMGVDPAQVEARLAALTPAERADLDARLSELPAGGDSVIGIIVFILVLLIVLDLLGATDIFPVIKPIGSK